MKKMMMALIAIMMLGANVMAQENNQEQVEQQERQRPDRTEMVKQRTEQMVKRYQLNETQAAQLLELNMRYADKMGPFMGRQRGFRGERQANRPQRRERRMEPVDSADQQRPRGDRREEMRKTMEAYEKELQEIMTEEQFQAYKKDNERRGPQGHRRGGMDGRRGQRPSVEE